MEYEVYLSCPMTGRPTQEVFDFQRRAQKRFDELCPTGYKIHGICPGRGENLEQFNTIPADIGNQEQDDNPIRTEAGIVGRDLNDLRRAKAILCHVAGFTGFSKGVFGEICWAYALNIPLVLVIEKAGNLHDVLFVRGQVRYRTTSLESGIKAVATLVLPVSPKHWKSKEHIL